jgi:ABC-2 type transport system ATP-binding protein
LTISAEMPIEFVRVRRQYAGGTGLEDLSLVVGRGEVVGLLGPNGAGKTTAVNLACGLLRPSAGEVRLFGDDPAGPAGRRVRARLGLVPQDSTLYPELTALEQLRLWAALQRLRRPAGRIEAVLRLVELWERRRDRVSTYSGGMRRRLALARALLHDPDVLLLDEPTLGVDIHGRRVLWDRVGELKAEGRSVLLTTNYREEASALCDTVVIVDRGAVVAAGSPRQLQAGLGQSRVVLSCHASTASVAAALEGHPGVRSATATAGGEVEVLLADDALAGDVIAAASAAGHVGQVRTEQPTLEDVFLALTGTGARD